MVSRKPPSRPHSAVEQQLEKEERGRLLVAKVRANKKFMDGVRKSLEARRRGEKGTPFEQLKRREDG